jgi:tetratricopeptide (TPR) repeat protein
VGAAKGGTGEAADSATGDPLQELESARAALAKAPKDADANFHFGLAWQHRADAEKDVAARRGFLDSARVALDSALAIDSTHVKSLVHSGLVLEDLGQPDEALRRYTRATQAAPDDPRPYVNLGSLLYFHFKRIYDAKVALTKALELDPTNADAHFNLGVMFADATMYREARTEWERVVATGSPAARALAQQNLDKIRPLLASQDSAEAAARPKGS